MAFGAERSPFCQRITASSAEDGKPPHREPWRAGMSIDLGNLLRHARGIKCTSQLELAFRLGVSQRHVSFVESGRARPSRDLLLAWLTEVDAPKPIRNAALLQAGFSLSGTPDGRAEVTHTITRAALVRMLQAHEPLPALAFDSDWRVVEHNAGCHWLSSVIMPGPWNERTDRRGLNLLDAAMHPQGFFSRIRNFEVVAPAMLMQLKAETWSRPELIPKAEAFEAFLFDRFGTLPPIEFEACQPNLDIEFETEWGCLSFLSIQSVFGLVQDVSPASYRLELWYPNDAATRDIVLAHSGADPASLPL